jgi:hypothetical protein
MLTEVADFGRFKGGKIVRHHIFQRRAQSIAIDNGMGEGIARLQKHRPVMTTKTPLGADALPNLTVGHTFIENAFHRLAHAIVNGAAEGTTLFLHRFLQNFQCTALFHGKSLPFIEVIIKEMTKFVNEKGCAS